MTAEELRNALQPFLGGELTHWRGLPEVTADLLAAALGTPAKVEESVLGDTVAERRIHPMQTVSGGLAAYVRRNAVVLIEALVPPPASVVEALGQPPEILPHEILVPGAYVHEYLYGDRGLLLSIAQPFDQEQPPRIVRCRGIRPVANANAVGSGLYLSFEDQTVWSG